MISWPGRREDVKYGYVMNLSFRLTVFPANLTLFFTDESPASCNLNTAKGFHGDQLKKNGLIKTRGAFIQIAGKARGR